MNVDDFEIKKTGILFFDMLNGYYHLADSAAKARMKPTVDNAVRLMRAGRASGIPIFFAKANHRSDGATTAILLTDANNDLEPWPGGKVLKIKPLPVAGDRSSEVIPELEPRPDDYYIPKYRWSAFYQTSLELALRARRIDTIIVSGGSTEVGVASTIYSARDRDFHTIVARDACSTSHSRDVHNALMDLIFPRMGRVRTTAQVVKMIEDASGTGSKS
jgi:nicotinamidase-related amidase